MEPRYNRTLERWQGGKQFSSDSSGLILHHPPVSSGKRPSQHAQCSACYEDQTFQQVSVLYVQPKSAEYFFELPSQYMSSVSSHELQDSSSDSQVLILQILSVALALH